MDTIFWLPLYIRSILIMVYHDIQLYILKYNFDPTIRFGILISFSKFLFFPTKYSNLCYKKIFLLLVVGTSHEHSKLYVSEMEHCRILYIKIKNEMDIYTLY